MLCELRIGIALNQAFAHDGILAQVFHYGVGELIRITVYFGHKVGANGVLRLQRQSFDAGPVERQRPRFAYNF